MIGQTTLHASAVHLEVVGISTVTLKFVDHRHTVILVAALVAATIFIKITALISSYLGACLCNRDGESIVLLIIIVILRCQTGCIALCIIRCVTRLVFLGAIRCAAWFVFLGSFGSFS